MARQRNERTSARVARIAGMVQGWASSNGGISHAWVVCDNLNGHYLTGEELLALAASCLTQTASAGDLVPHAPCRRAPATVEESRELFQAPWPGAEEVMIYAVPFVALLAVWAMWIYRRYP